MSKLPRARTKLNNLKHLIVIIVGMSGLRLDRSRGQILLALIAIGISISAGSQITSRRIAIAYVVAVWCIYYLGHVLFYRYGLHRSMKRTWGTKLAWQIYETLLGVVFFNQGLSQARLLQVYEGSASVNSFLLVGSIVGVMLIATAFVAKVWATAIVGLDVYYYRDMFVEIVSNQGLAVTGPYAIFKNPMYSIGNLSMYGGAILAGSYEGFVVAVLFHVSIYGFYFAVERPFVVSMYGDDTEFSSIAVAKMNG